MIGGIAAGTWRALVATCEAAWPREACGWLTDEALRAARPGERDSFAFADDELLALWRAQRDGPAPRALFHSHPRGPATLSARDREALAPGGVVLHPLPHVVVAVASGRAVAATLYRWRGGEPVIAATATRAGDDDDRWDVGASEDAA